MPASIPAYLLHSSADITRLGLEGEPDGMWLHGITDRAFRRRMTITDEARGWSIYEGFVETGAEYSVDCHAHGLLGLANYHPGQSVSMAVLGACFQDLPFRFSSNVGTFIYSDPVRERASGEMHRVTFTILHLFPEGGTATDILPSDPDEGAAVIITDPPVDEPGGIDPETGAEDLQTYRLQLQFTPALGYGGSASYHVVTRFITSTAAQSLAQIYYTLNPPGSTWQSTPGPSRVRSGPAYDGTDAEAVQDTAIPGRWHIRDIYHLESSTWLLDSGEFTDADAFDSAAHGTDVITIEFTDSARRLLIGDFATLAAVRTELGLADNSTLSYVKNHRTGATYYGTALSTALDFWRTDAEQPVAPDCFAFWICVGTRQSPAGRFWIIRCTTNDFTPASGGVAGSTFPTVPGPVAWNTPSGTGELDEVTACYSPQADTYDLGDSSAFTTLGYSAPSAATDLWVLQYGGSSGAASYQWRYIIGDLVDEAALVASIGVLTNYRVVYHATANHGQGEYVKGSNAYGNPLELCPGLSLF